MKKTTKIIFLGILSVSVFCLFFTTSCTQNPEKAVQRYAKKNMPTPIEIVEISEPDSLYSPHEERLKFEKLEKVDTQKVDSLYNLVAYKDMSDEKREACRAEMNETVKLIDNSRKRVDSLLHKAPVNHKAIKVRYINKGSVLSQAKELYFVYAKNKNKITHTLEEKEVNEYNLLRK